MYGRNPKTGKPIRIMKSETSIWKNQKTLVWLRGALVKKNMDRWDTVCVGMKELTAARDANLRIDAVILLENTKDEIQYLKQRHLHGSTMIFLSRTIVPIMGESTFANLQLRNVVCLEEMSDVFPFVGEKWNGSGLHTNVSTLDTRNDGGYEVIKQFMEKFSSRHTEHIVEYGDLNNLRLTGIHETSSLDKFTWGVASRASSVRIPRETEQNNKGYFEDRRPAGWANPYRIACRIMKTILE